MIEKTLQRYMVHTNPGRATFVKDREYFLAAGGDVAPWGKAWEHVEAVDLDVARAIGCVLQGGNKGQIPLWGVRIPNNISSRVDEDGHMVWREA